MTNESKPGHSHDHREHTYDVVFTNSMHAQLHIYVVAPTNTEAIQDAMAQVCEWGQAGAITGIAVNMLCK